MPFITLIFWALGGGKVSSVQAQDLRRSGLNTDLPGARLTKENVIWDKLALYEQAKRDSTRYEEARRNDPYFVTAALTPDDTTQPGSVNTSLGKKKHYSALKQQEENVTQRLEELNTHLNRPSATFRSASVVPMKTTPAVAETHQDPGVSADVDRLEKMMQLMQDEGTNDPEMAQIDGVLDKILDIQHPQRVQDKLKAQSLSQRDRVFAVETMSDETPVSLMAQNPERPAQAAGDSAHVVVPASFMREQNGFYGLDDQPTSESSSNAIEAVVHETQTVVVGSTIKIRLLQDVYINGQLIPKDQFIYGTCSIAGERLVISINSIHSDNSIFPVDMKVYDTDGMEGIYVPGAISRDAAKQASSQSIQEFQMMSMDQSLGVQAASAGIEAAKGLFSKKIRLIKVTVKAGYKILLLDTHGNS
jgi:conjugative transposon TraM protein